MAKNPKPQKAAASAAGEPIRVRAIALGIFDGGRKKPGAEFTVPNEEALGSWMERLDAPAEAPAAPPAPPADPPKDPMSDPKPDA